MAGRTVVLVHGAWHTGDHWREVADRLSAAGLDPHAPTLPGRGPGSPAGVGLAACAAHVADHLRRHRLRDVVLLGHSSGGPVSQLVVEQVPDRVGRLALLDGFVLGDGQSILDTVEPAMAAAFDALAAARADGTVMVPWELWRDVFMHDAPAERSEQAYRTLVPEPYAVLTEKAALPTFPDAAVPRTYISCRQDINLPPPGWHPGHSSRLGAFDLVEIDGSHEVLLTRPAELAAAIAGVARS